MRQILARKDLVQLGEIEIGSWRYRYGSLFLSQLRLSPKQFVWFLSFLNSIILVVYKNVSEF